MFVLDYLGIIEANITVVLLLEESYLATPGEDYGQLINSDIIFTPDNAQDVMCRQISLLDDELAEENEMFFSSSEHRQCQCIAWSTNQCHYIR